MKIRLDAITPNPEQPRMALDQQELEDLAESIKLHGVINPISVEDAGSGHYILIDGERRWRAARMAGLAEIEASIRPGLNGSGQVDRLILSMVANVQRSNMNHLEKALAAQKLCNLGLTQQEAAREMNISPMTISNYMVLLKLPDFVQSGVASGRLPFHALLLRALENMEEKKMRVIVKAADQRNLSGVQIMTLIRRIEGGKKAGHRMQQQTKMRQELSDLWAGRWNMIAQAGNPKMPVEMQDAAIKVCKDCVLFDEASPAICRECPAPQLLKLLLEDK